MDSLGGSKTKYKILFATPVAQGWKKCSEELPPKDGKEFLVRYPLQANVKELVYWDVVHKRFLSKGEAVFIVEQQCDWHPLPPEIATPAEALKSPT